MVQTHFCRHSTFYLFFFGVFFAFNLIVTAEVPIGRSVNLSHHTTRPLKLKILKKSFLLSNQARISLSYQSSFENLASLLPIHLEKQLISYQSQFGDVPLFKLKIKLLTPETFYQITRAPQWTNALYYKNQILIPVKEMQSPFNLLKILNHEFAHALTASLSNNNCPGWLDEGIAQLIEEQEHHLLKSVLTEWLSDKQLIDFNKLQSGFTRLPSSIIPVAYAQSLITVDFLINSGYQSQINRFLRNKRKLTNHRFWKVIGIDQRILGKQIIELVLKDRLPEEPKGLQIALNLYSPPILFDKK